MKSNIPNMSNYNNASAPIYAEAIAVNTSTLPHAVAQPVTQERSARYESEQEAAARDDPHDINSPVNSSGAHAYLKEHKWPVGLAETLIHNLEKMPIRFIICDDSGSMMANDGHRFMLQTNGKMKDLPCSRWSELTCSLRFHAGLAKHANAATEFRLLNNSSPIIIGGNQAHPQNYDNFLTCLDGSPVGGTPLCRHVREITAKIRAMAPELRRNNQKACVVIATDGESSDGDVAEAMAHLRELPVWVVIRLCTDDSRVVSYWNAVDSQLELPMDVLDDWQAEASEVSSLNRWLTYGEPLHRMREFGIPVKEIDCLDEQSLSLEQIRKICIILFGGGSDAFPNPEVDLKGFMEAVTGANRREGKVWAPDKTRFQDWVVTSHIPGSGSCSVS